jgi:Protein of unknown function (DUF3592)
MKKLIETTIGVLAGIAFLAAAAAIFVWDVGKLRQAHDSQAWPQATGIVTRSFVDDRRSEQRPHVEYTYSVAGNLYTSGQISFDIFDKPGGEGRIETIMARYPTGLSVTVYYDPDAPATAILEPGVYSPFLLPLLFGSIFLFGGARVLWMAYRQMVLGRTLDQQEQRSKHRIFATAIVSVLIYAALVLTSFDSAVRDTFLKTFGVRPAGMPNILFVIALQTLLYLPMPWVFWHAMRLVFQARDDDRRFGIGYLLTAGDFHPELRRSQTVCVGGLVYFLVIGAAWIVYASARGI